MVLAKNLSPRAVIGISHLLELEQNEQMVEPVQVLEVPPPVVDRVLDCTKRAFNPAADMRYRVI